jgi:hypothetical protein
MEKIKTQCYVPTNIINPAKNFLDCRWRIFYLPGQDEPFIWDASSEFLVKIPRNIAESLEECEYFKSNSKSLKEILGS